MVKPPGQTAKGTKDRILDAADAVFVRHGTDGARMQDIADQAGVNKALLHYHFRSKAELARAVWARIASSFLPQLFQMMASDASLDDKIDRFVDAYHQRLGRHPYLAAYIVSEAARHPELVESFYSAERVAAVRSMLAKLGQQIGEQVELGRMAPVSPEHLWVTLVSVCIFPFAARPNLTPALGLGQKGYDALLEQRRRDLPAFLKRALRP